jgi:hypothetical protein
MGQHSSLFFPHDIDIEATLCAGNTKGGSITVPLTSYLTGFESAV